MLWCRLADAIPWREQILIGGGICTLTCMRKHYKQGHIPSFCSVCYLVFVSRQYLYCQDQLSRAAFLKVCSQKPWGSWRLLQGLHKPPHHNWPSSALCFVCSSASPSSFPSGSGTLLVSSIVPGAASLHACTGTLDSPRLHSCAGR